MGLQSIKDIIKERNKRIMMGHNNSEKFFKKGKNYGKKKRDV